MKVNKQLVATCAGLALSVTGAAAPAHAAILINSGGQVYAQNFDTLTTTAALGQTWLNDSTLSGWNLFRQPAPGTALTTYGGGTGSSLTGSFFSFGALASPERALGGLGSAGVYFGSPATGNIAGWIAAAFMNSSGLALDGFSLAFDGEQWRNGGNTSLAAQTMVFEYGFGSTFSGVGSWLQPGGVFDWTSTVNTATAGLVDGNAAGLVSNRGGTINDTWNANDTLWLRWVERNDISNDHGLAIDNLSFTAGQAIPEPATLALLGLGLAGLGFSRRRQ